MSHTAERLSRAGFWLSVEDGEPLEPVPGIEVWTVGTETLMLALMRFAPGTDVPVHAHHNEQAGTVIEGSLTLTIGEETRTVTRGQGYLIPANVSHAATAGPEGALMAETFSPPRESYLMPGPQPR